MVKRTYNMVNKMAAVSPTILHNIGCHCGGFSVYFIPEYPPPTIQCQCGHRILQLDHNPE